MKRRSIWKVPLLALLLCTLFAGWRLWAAVQQVRYNAALIRAIRRDDAGGVSYWLARGADANAREETAARVSLWQQVSSSLRGCHPKHSESVSALYITVKRHWTVGAAFPSETHFTILKALHDAGAKAEGDALQYDAEYRKILAAMPDGRGLPDSSGAERNYEFSASELRSFLLAHGMSGRAFKTLAECELWQERYGWAIQYCRAAQMWLPGDSAIPVLMAQAEAAVRAEKGINALLPAASKVFAVRPFPGESGLPCWAAVYGKTATGTGICDVQAALYQEAGASYRLLGEYPPLKRQKIPAGYGGTVFETAELYVLPLTGRRVPEIAVQEEESGGSLFCFSRLDILEWREGRLHSVFAAVSDNPFQIEDRRHEDRYEVRDEYVTGVRDITPALLPCSDIYAWNGTRFAFADADFPDAFADYVHEAEQHLKTYPDDYDLLQRVAYFYSLTGKRQKAEQYWQKAEWFCRKKIKQEGAGEESDYDRSILRQIMRRRPQSPH